MEPPPGLARLDCLVLLRVSAGGEKGATRSQIEKDLKPYWPEGEAGDAWADRIEPALGRLESAGLLVRTRKGKTDKCAATPEGARTIPAALVLEELPGNPNFKKLLDLALAQLAGVPPGTKIGALKDAMTRSEFGVPPAPPARGKAKPPALADSLAWVRIGMPEAAGRKFDAKSVLAAILTRDLAPPRPVEPKDALDRTLAARLGARTTKKDDLLVAAIRKWVAADGGPSGTPEAPPQPPDLEAFARRVREAARAGGDGKVFIARVWDALRGDPSLGVADLDAFKRRLALANQARLIDLGRADLVAAMDPKVVAESELTHQGASYHFIRP